MQNQQIKMKDYSKRFNKKGFSPLVIVIMVFIIAIMLPVFNIIMGTFTESLSDAADDPITKERMQFLGDGYMDNNDLIFAFTFFALYLSAIIIAFFLDTHPIFLVGGVLLYLITGWFSLILANSYYDITHDAGALTAEMVRFPVTSFIMGWYGELSILLMVTVLIITYKKNN